MASAPDRGPASAHPLNRGRGLVRTDMTCTNCHKAFVAELDFDVDGNHMVECAHCGHEHCRVIKNGQITEERWSSREQRVDVERRRVWKSDALPARTTVASEFIRQRWLNMGTDNDGGLI